MYQRICACWLTFHRPCNNLAPDWKWGSDAYGVACGRLYGFFDNPGPLGPLRPTVGNTVDISTPVSVTYRIQPRYRVGFGVCTHKPPLKHTLSHTLSAHTHSTHSLIHSCTLSLHTLSFHSLSHTVSLSHSLHTLAHTLCTHSLHTLSHSLSTNSHTSAVFRRGARSRCFQTLRASRYRVGFGK